MRGNERKEAAGKTVFKSREHEEFYRANLPKCRCQDEYHRALIYCLGIDRDTREHADEVYDFKSGCVKPECLHKGWLTSGSERVIRMAFNLYCNGTPSVDCYKKSEDKLRECQLYTVEELFCCGNAIFFWEAIRLRYPNECAYA